MTKTTLTPEPTNDERLNAPFGPIVAMVDESDEEMAKANGVTWPGASRLFHQNAARLCDNEIQTNIPGQDPPIGLGVTGWLVPRPSHWVPRFQSGPDASAAPTRVSQRDILRFRVLS